MPAHTADFQAILIIYARRIPKGPPHLQADPNWQEDMQTDRQTDRQTEQTDRTEQTEQTENRIKQNRAEKN